MTATPEPAAPPPPPAAPEPKLDPQSLVMRARPTRPVRFRRGIIIAGAGAAALVLMSITWFALSPAGLGDPLLVEHEGGPANRPTADTLAGLPSSYGDAPKLGPPLPGDLGKPILDHQRAIGTAPAPSDAAERARVERERRAEAQRAARRSPLLVATGTRSTSQTASLPAFAPATEAGAGVALPSEPIIDASRDPNGQARKIAFARSGSEGASINPHRVEAAPSPYLLSAGSVIAASLITGIRSDLPGLVTAQVTQNVFDSATGQILLVPQGARLIGSYDSVVAFGQSRALVIWQRIVFPDGASLALDTVPASDPSGYAGLADKVDFHSWSLLKGIALSTLLGVAPELALSGESDLVAAIRRSTQDNVARAGDQITARNLNIQPSITIRPGAPVRLVVHRDLVLQPWH